MKNTLTYDVDWRSCRKKTSSEVRGEISEPKLRPWILGATTAANYIKIKIILSKAKHRDKIAPENDRYLHLITVHVKTPSNGGLGSSYYNNKKQTYVNNYRKKKKDKCQKDNKGVAREGGGSGVPLISAS